MTHWTAEQERVIGLPLGHASVLACAGSGKTAVIVERLTRLSASQTIDPNRAAIITFTRLAAEELRTRITRSFSAAALIGTPYIGTIHGFCLQLLKSFDPEAGERLNVLTEAQQFALLFAKWNEWGLGRLQSTGGSRSRCLRALVKTFDILDLDQCDLTSIEGAPEALSEIRQVYLDWLRQNFYLDYSGMLRVFRESLSDETFRAHVADQIQYLIVDEYQDTDPLQGDIFTNLARLTPLLVVGDDDQCIYQFRGTTPDNIIKFAETVGGSQEFLSTNFRCGAAIVALAEAKVETIAQRSQKKMGASHNGGSIIVKSFDDPTAEANWIASEIDRLLTTGLARDPSDIAILMRSTSSYGHFYTDALDGRRIPYVIRGDGSLLQQEEVRAALSALEIIQREVVEATCVDLVHDILGRELEGADGVPTDADLAVLTYLDWIGLGCTEREAEVLVRVLGLRDRFESQKFGSCLEFFLLVLVALGVAEADLGLRVHRNWAQLTQIVAEYDDVIGGRNVRQLLNYLKSYGRDSFDAADVTPKDDAAVHVLTVHRAKGLEFRHVFIPMLVEGRFPVAPRVPDTLLPNTNTVVRRYAGGRDDEARLFYVATTRAMDRLCLSNSRNVTAVRAATPSTFLIGIDRFLAINAPRPFTKADREIVSLSTSYSKLEYYLSCPFRYQLLFDLGYVTPPNPFFSFGRVLHFVLRTAHDAFRGGNPMTEQQVDELFERQFEAVSGVPVLTLNGMRRRGLAALKAYIEHHRDWLEATRQTEMPFAYVDEQALGGKTLRVTLSGQADLLIDGANGPHVIDFKSGKPHPYIRTDLQLRLYCLALRQVHGLDVTKATIYYVEHDQAVDYDVSRSWVDDGAAEFRSTAAAIASRRYDATPGDVCGRCEVRKLCAHGGRV